MTAPNVFELARARADQPHSGAGRRVLVNTIFAITPGNAGAGSVNLNFVGTFEEGIQALAGRFTATELRMMIEALKVLRSGPFTPCMTPVLLKTLSGHLNKRADDVRQEYDQMYDKREGLDLLQEGALSEVVSRMARDTDTNSSLDDTARLAAEYGLELAPSV